MTVKTGPVLSVVDYDAWNKGYMPPSEHILIDKLAYRGARVNLSTPISKDHQLWVVVEGPPMTRKQRRLLMEVMKIWFEDEPEQESAPRMTATQNIAEGDPPVKSDCSGAEPSTDTGSVT